MVDQTEIQQLQTNKTQAELDLQRIEQDYQTRYQRILDTGGTGGTNIIQRLNEDYLSQKQEVQARLKGINQALELSKQGYTEGLTTYAGQVENVSRNESQAQLYNQRIMNEWADARRKAISQGLPIPPAPGKETTQSQQQIQQSSGEVPIYNAQGQLTGVQSSYFQQSMLIEEYNRRIENLPKEQFYNPISKKTYETQQKFNIGKAEFISTPVKIYTNPKTGQPIEDIQSYLKEQKIPIPQQSEEAKKSTITPFEDYLKNPQTYDIDRLYREAIYVAPLGSGSVMTLTPEDISGVSLISLPGKAVSEVIEKILPPDISIQRQVERGLLYGATSFIPGVGTSYGINLASEFINRPVETFTGALEYGKKYPFELGAMLFVGKIKSIGKNLAKASKLGISYSDLQVLKEYNKLSAGQFKEKYGLLGLKDYSTIQKKIIQNTLDLDKYSLLYDAKMTKGGLSYETAIKLRQKEILKEFPEYSRVQKEVFNRILDEQKKLEDNVLKYGSEAQKTSEKLKEKNPIKYGNLVEDAIVKQAEDILANSPLFKYDDILKMQYGKGYVEETLTNRKIAKNFMLEEGKFEDSFTKRRVDITAFGQNQKIKINQFEQLAFLSEKDLEFMNRGFMKDIRRFTESGKGSVTRKGQEDYEKILLEDFEKRREGNILPPLPTSFNTRGFFEQIKAWRKGLIYGEGNEAVFIPFKTRGKYTTEGKVQKVKVELAKGNTGTIEPMEYIVQLEDGRFAEVIKAIQSVKDLVAPIKKLSVSKKGYEKLKERAILPEELGIPTKGFIKLGKGRIDVTNLVKLAQDEIKNEARQFGQNFEQIKQTKASKYYKTSEFAELQDIAKFGKDELQKIRNTLKEIYGNEVEVKKIVSQREISPEELINLGTSEQPQLVKVREAVRPTISPKSETQKIRSKSSYEYGSENYYKTLSKNIEENFARISKGFSQPSIIVKAPTSEVNFEASVNAFLNPQINPLIESNINPNIGVNINPQIMPQITPTISPEININPLINPQINPLINPQINPLINPQINPNITPIIVPEIKKPKIPKFKIEKESKQLFKKKSLGAGYWVYVKQIKGTQFNKVNNYPLTKSRAEDIGTYLVDTSVARTFQVKPANLQAQEDYEFMYVPEGYYQSRKGKLRQYRVKNKQPYAFSEERFIERKGFVGDTPQEIKQLQAFQRQVKKVMR